ncbi:hypothetical protein ASO20_01120 [Mycoplasma sp. (ex Biomphalaria glabrata)]|uniref:phosphoribosylformylglycinamidine synthase n=1 Tax=Mycoplasma sp. (ex Biomphalaria glabrata) TaxID=1749074 RepID=UPI00073AAE81|nr:phosphoribosylformylglycinamidine synthase [Mycoplasma sp. (ex Biomphalaria glabrata)]ALV23259.1 hypothetical protein ASO20_01120 [Mycoplasma sp. (ex Biomphalaria glabrata)]
MRYFVKRKNGFNMEEKSLFSEFQNDLNIETLESIEYYNVYDIFNATKDEENFIMENILAKVNTDSFITDIDLKDQKFLSYEPLPLQFDIRKDNAEKICKLNFPNKDIEIFTGTLLVFNEKLSDNEFNKISNYIINPIESRLKELFIFEKPEFTITPFENKEVSNFNLLSINELNELVIELGLSLDKDDLVEIQKYFKSIDRNPNFSELTLFDIYWSDHCRHTTFSTEITDVELICYDVIDEEIKNTITDYNATRKMLKLDKKPLTLMEMATINARLEKYRGNLNDLEESDEINACSIKFEANKKNYYFNFKNETHNHPTEIEPFGGASTCLGGAIRDILANRAYAFAGIRISGCGNILEKVENTLEGKLPQRKISKQATRGFSSYGNQIGMPCLLVEEFYDPSYVAKHLECGAVLGVAPENNLNKKEPQPGDVIILFGGRTGIDGIGGASGSSKSHKKDLSKNIASEVQKGNAIIQRNMQRLFRKNYKFSQLIKKCNDFGAGGASVAIGEISDGVEIYLDKFLIKYKGINPYQILFSESQERMAVVVDPENVKKFINICNKENLEAYVVGKVTADEKLVAKYKNDIIVNIDRSFLKTNGAKKTTQVKICGLGVPNIVDCADVWDGSEMNKDLNLCVQKGMIEYFDSSIGRTTVMSPYAGKHLLSKTNTLVAKIPLDNEEHNFKAIVGVGFSPAIANHSSYHAGIFSVIESVSKIVARGGKYQKIRFSFQEYFCRLTSPEKWAQPFLALLGAYKSMKALNLASIGGKDSMSGSFEKIDVVPTIISFGFTVEELVKVKPSHFVQSDSFIYFIKLPLDNLKIPDYDKLKEIYELIGVLLKDENVNSIIVNSNRRIYETLMSAAIGNMLGLNLFSEDLNQVQPGSFIIESSVEVDHPLLRHIGNTIHSSIVIIDNKLVLDMKNAPELPQIKEYLKIYSAWPNQIEQVKKPMYYNIKDVDPLNKKKCHVLIPIFPGTNCEYDLQKAFENEGAKTELFIFTNLNRKSIEKSIDELAKKIAKCDIFAIPGGFSAADEPDGSGKFIANILRLPKIAKVIHEHLKAKKLIIGICNGFQALVEAGLLPQGNFMKKSDSPTLTYNTIGRHASSIVTTRVISNASPWLRYENLHTINDVPISNGEGRFVLSKEQLTKYLHSGQIFSIYWDEGEKFPGETYNYSGSIGAIEGIVSSDGLILGRMGHPERIASDLFQNLSINTPTNVFKNGVKYIVGYKKSTKRGKH